MNNFFHSSEWMVNTFFRVKFGLFSLMQKCFITRGTLHWLTAYWSPLLFAFHLLFKRLLILQLHFFFKEAFYHKIHLVLKDVKVLWKCLCCSGSTALFSVSGHYSPTLLMLRPACSILGSLWHVGLHWERNTYVVWDGNKAELTAKGSSMESVLLLVAKH